MKRIKFIQVFLLFLFCGISSLLANGEGRATALPMNLGYYTTTNTSGQSTLITENFIQNNQDVDVYLNTTGLISCSWTLMTPETASCTPISGTSPAFSFCVEDQAPVVVTFKVVADYGSGPEVLMINFRVRKFVG